MADLHIWDTLGQEKFQSIANIFFKGTVAAFLVFDLTDRVSFDKLDIWLNKAIEGCESRVVISLIGNKCDLPNRAVSQEEINEYAKSNGLNYMEVSAKSGYNVTNAF